MIPAIALPSVASAAGNCAAGDPAIDAEEAAFLTIINTYRAQNGSGPLVISPDLNRSAAWMVTDMGTKGYFAHTDSLGRSPWTRMADCGAVAAGGENLAAGTNRSTATAAFELFRGSPGHNANMIVPEFRFIGIARVFVEGSKYGWYWATTFGYGLQPAAPPPTPAPASPAPPAAPRPQAPPAPVAAVAAAPSPTAAPSAVAVQRQAPPPASQPVLPAAVEAEQQPDPAPGPDAGAATGAARLRSVGASYHLAAAGVVRDFTAFRTSLPTSPRTPHGWAHQSRRALLSAIARLAAFDWRRIEGGTPGD